METVTVEELFVYPVKGLQATPVDTLEITQLGIVGDREFAIWEDGRLVDQKADQWVAAIAADFEPTTGLLTLSHPDHPTFTHTRQNQGETRQGQWVLDELELTDQGDEIASWLSAVLGREVRLVDAKSPWQVNMPVPDLQLVHGTPKTRFNAVSSVSLGNQASLDELNTHLDAPVEMDRFRLNVTVSGIDPFAEEHAVQFFNGDVSLTHVSTAERCIIITTDQTTGERPKNNLLRTLRAQHMKAEELRYGSGMKFGSYLTVDKPGHLAVGDSLIVTGRPAGPS